MVRRTLNYTLTNRRITMLYSAILSKAKTYLPSEAYQVSIIFFAENDTEARRYLETITKIMNKGYAKINQPRGIIYESLCQIHRTGHFGAENHFVLNVFIKDMNLPRWKDLRSAYRALFPRKLIGANGVEMFSLPTSSMHYERTCSIPSFYQYKPKASYSKKKRQKKLPKDTSLGT
jgi:hypothetical protein